MRRFGEIIARYCTVLQREGRKDVAFDYIFATVDVECSRMFHVIAHRLLMVTMH